MARTPLDRDVDRNIPSQPLSLAWRNLRWMTFALANLTPNELLSNLAPPGFQHRGNLFTCQMFNSELLEELIMLPLSSQGKGGVRDMTESMPPPTLELIRQLNRSLDGEGAGL